MSNKEVRLWLSKRPGSGKGSSTVQDGDQQQSTWQSDSNALCKKSCGWVGLFSKETCIMISHHIRHLAMLLHAHIISSCRGYSSQWLDLRCMIEVICGPSKADQDNYEPRPDRICCGMAKFRKIAPGQPCKENVGIVTRMKWNIMKPSFPWISFHSCCVFLRIHCFFLAFPDISSFQSGFRQDLCTTVTTLMQLKHQIQIHNLTTQQFEYDPAFRFEDFPGWSTYYIEISLIFIV